MVDFNIHKKNKNNYASGETITWHTDATMAVSFSPGLVEFSPSMVALVCEAGDQLELTCNSSSPLHTWQFTVISESGEAMTYKTLIQSAGPTGLLSSQEQLTINSTIMFTFSRLSTERDTSLITRVIIDSVSEGLNGVEIQCIDAGMINAATTTIHIIGGKPLSLIFAVATITLHNYSTFYSLLVIQFGGKGCGSFTCCPPTLINFCIPLGKKNSPFSSLHGGRGGSRLWQIILGII